MKCKHRNFELDGEYDICPECGKSLKDEPEEEKVELPQEKDETELSKDDQFTANFISKDDPLKHISEPKGTSTGMITARIAALLALLFFGAVMYYTQVYLPKHQTKQKGGVYEIIDDYNYEGSSSSSNKSYSTGKVEFTANFGDESILTQMKRAGYEYNKDMYEVNVTVDFGELANGTRFKVVLYRTKNGSSYSSDISFMLQEARITGVTKSSANYNEDLITNILNNYVVKEFDGGVIMYSQASSFQLGTSLPIIMVKGNNVKKIENVITTYSPDGSSITQCPVTINGTNINYCAYLSEFKKGENIEIRNMTFSYAKDEMVTGTVQGMVSK